MNVSRETIEAALFALLSGSSSFATTGRRLKYWGDVAEQPALFLRSTGEHHAPQEGRGQPQKVILEYDVFIYTKTGSPTAIPSQAISPLLDALDAALQPSPMTGVQQLGVSAVQHCWREGHTPVDTGDAMDQAVAVASIRVLVV
ncbi:MAG: hypothetical protein V4564_07815 [Pseudomonadota bacterium]